MWHIEPLCLLCTPKIRLSKQAERVKEKRRGYWPGSVGLPVGVAVPVGRHLAGFAWFTCHPIADSPLCSLPGIYHSPINECISLSWIKLQDARKHEYDIEIALEVGKCGSTICVQIVPQRLGPGIILWSISKLILLFIWLGSSEEIDIRPMHH